MTSSLSFESSPRREKKTGQRLLFPSLLPPPFPSPTYFSSPPLFFPSPSLRQSLLLIINEKQTAMTGKGLSKAHTREGDITRLCSLQGSSLETMTGKKDAAFMFALLSVRQSPFNIALVLHMHNSPNHSETLHISVANANSNS